MSHSFHTRTRSALAVAAGLVLAAASPSYADPPDQDRGEFSFESTYAAGEFCDVAVHELAEIQYVETTFGDDRRVFHQRVVFTHTNLVTGATVTDTGSMTNWQPGDGTLIVTGLTVQLRGTDGRIYGISAGRVVIDLETFEIISSSGGDVGDYATAVCAALGAEPSA